jgi:hypothetical protein
MGKIEESRTKSVGKINRDYNRSLRKIAKTPIDFETRRISDFHSGRGPGSMDGIVHLIDMNSGRKIVSLTVILHYTAYGLARPVIWEGLTCYCGTLVDRPIPASIFVKNVKEGMRVRPCFLPPVETLNFNAKDVLNKRTDWNHLLDNLNGDDSLRGLMRRLPTEKTIYGIDEKYQVGKNKIWNYKLDDQNDNYNTPCQIIPLGNKTLIATRHMVKNPRRIEQAVKAINQISDHVMNYGYSKLSIGQIPQRWANDVIELVKHSAPPTETPSVDVKSKLETPSKPYIQKAKQMESISLQICPVCSVNTSPDMRFCGECGVNLVSKRDRSTCPRCGAETHPRMIFCGNCGVRLKP